MNIQEFQKMKVSDLPTDDAFIIEARRVHTWFWGAGHCSNSNCKICVWPSNDDSRSESYVQQTQKQ